MRRRWTKVECELRIGQGGDFDVRAGRLRKYAMVDLFGTPFTERLQAVERYRLINFEEAKDKRRWLEPFNGLVAILRRRVPEHLFPYRRSLERQPTRHYEPGDQRRRPRADLGDRASQQRFVMRIS